MIVTKLGGVFNRCPKAWLRDEASEMVDLIKDADRFKSYKVAPRSGGMLDQDARFVEALDFYESEIPKVEEAVRVANGGGKK